MDNTWQLIGIALALAGISMFLGAGIGHYNGYKSGWHGGRAYQKLSHEVRYECAPRKDIV